MAIFRQVQVSFWQDVRVIEEMTSEDKYFYLYLLTNPCTTQIGIYQITKKQIAFDIGYSPEAVNALIDRFEKHHKLIKYNAETRELVVKNWAKYNLNRGGKPIIDCVTKELKDVKDRNLLRLVIPNISNESIKNVFLTFIDDTPHDTSNDTLTPSGEEKEQEQEEEEEKEKEQEEEEKKIKNYPVVENLAIDFYMKNFGVISPFMGEEINNWVEDLNEDLVVKAMQITLENNKRNWSYVKGILKDWHSNNFKTVQDVEAAQEAFRRQQQNKKRIGTGYKKRQEVVPDWLHQQEEQESESQQQQNESPDIEEERKRLDAVLQKYKHNRGE
ncbi:DnaD domain protein [Bacillus sp. 3103sda1]|uniref:DnaD domain-containing protein n=1 Tax=Bacillus sp. 3103sda1 TaxID=2953808 RepID=UPI00209D4E82|nr:DnaD domain protein [Bacillus sp. 3103sda1]MCP1124593.1 DnaD domain protein [Bacillus sp. 3103sda1]